MRWRRSAGPMTAGNSRTHRRVSWSRGGAIGRLVRSDLFLAALRELAARGWSARAHVSSAGYPSRHITPKTAVCCRFGYRGEMAGTACLWFANEN
jgi:hypothetical protein